MSKSTTTGLERLGVTLLYLGGAWMALTVLIVAAPWAPDEAWIKSVRLVLLFVAGAALLLSVFGAATGVLGLFGMSVKPEPQPRPYEPAATLPA